MPYALGSVMMFGFVLFCVLDVILSDESRIRNLPKMIWLILVVLLPLIGGIAWLIAGRPETSGPRPGGQPARGQFPGRPPPSRGASPPPARRPRGPDDDPEFLRRLDERFRGDADGT